MLIAFIFTSCSIEKRRYTDGYHVEWHHKNKDTRIANSDTKKDIVVLDQLVALQNLDNQNIPDKSSIINPSESQLNEIQPSVVSEVKHQSDRILVAKKKAVNPGLVAEKLLSNTLIRHQRATDGALNFEATGENNTDSDADTLLLIIIAIFISPLAVFLHEGSWNSKCWINLVLWLLFIFPGFIHALIVILG